MILEFNIMKEGLILKKLDRFEKLKVRDFSGTLEDNEKIEYDKVYKWVKLHKKLIC